MSAPKPLAVLRKLSPSQVDLLVSIAYRVSQTARDRTYEALRETKLIRRSSHGKDAWHSLSWHVTALGKAVANEAAPSQTGSNAT